MDKKKLPPVPAPRKAAAKDEYTTTPKNAPAPSGYKSKFKEESAAAKPSDKLRREGENPANASDNPTSGQVDPKLGPAAKANSKSAAEPNPKTKTKEEKQAAREEKRLDKSKFRAKKSGEKLDTARDKLVAQKPYKPPGIGERLVQTAKYEAIAQAHRKIHEVEGENVGVEAAHRGEIYAERAGRFAVRHVKHRIRTRPARRVRKLERKNIRAKADYRYRQTLKENPALRKNALKRYLHKKRIQRQFRKQAQKNARKATFQAFVKTKAVVRHFQQVSCKVRDSGYARQESRYALTPAYFSQRITAERNPFACHFRNFRA